MTTHDMQPEMTDQTVRTDRPAEGQRIEPPMESADTTGDFANPMETREAPAETYEAPAETYRKNHLSRPATGPPTPARRPSRPMRRPSTQPKRLTRCCSVTVT